MSNEKILILDDEPEIVAIISRALGQHGYEILTATGGAEAIQIVDELGGSIDLLISDVVMPGMGGREVVWHLQERYPRLKVILLSGYADMAGAMQMIDSEYSTFLEKPINLKHLAATVREVLDQGT